MIYVVKHIFFRHYFKTLNFDGSPFLGQLRYERVIYLKGKPYYLLFERNFETGRIFAMEGSKQVLVDLIWNSTTSTKTGLEPSIGKILQVSKLFLNNK